MMEYFYPAICFQDQKSGIFTVSFPDIMGCEARSRHMDEAVKRARESLAASLLEMEEKELQIPEPTDERILHQRYRQCQICTFLVDMDAYRSYKEYKVQKAESKNAEWAASARSGKHTSFLAKVFGLR